MPVPSGRLDLLRWQYRMTSGLLFDVRLPALTDDLCRWSPVSGAWTVHRDRRGRWRPDWSDTDVDPAPPVTVAWLSWHVIWWWTQTDAVLDGQPVPGQADIDWPGSASGTARPGAAACRVEQPARRSGRERARPAGRLSVAAAPAAGPNVGLGELRADEERR